MHSYCVYQTLNIIFCVVATRGAGVMLPSWNAQSRNGSNGMTENTCKFRLRDHITSHNASFSGSSRNAIKLLSYLVCCSAASPSLFLGYLAALPSHIHCLRPTASTSLLFVFHLSTPRSCGFLEIFTRQFTSSGSDM